MFNILKRNNKKKKSEEEEKKQEAANTRQIEDENKLLRDQVESMQDVIRKLLEHSNSMEQEKEARIVVLRSICKAALSEEQDSKKLLSDNDVMGKSKEDLLIFYQARSVVYKVISQAMDDLNSKGL